MNKLIAMLLTVGLFVTAVDTATSTTQASDDGVVIIVPTPASTSSSLDDGLVAYYPFEGNADDASGNGNHGTEHGAVLTEDRFGNAESAYSFDGLDDYVTVANNFSNFDEFTLSGWFLGYSNNNGYSRMLQTAGGAIEYFHDNQKFIIEIQQDRNGGANSEVATRYLYQLQANFIEQWVHLVFTVFSDNTAKFFINGVEVTIGERITDGGQTSDSNFTNFGARRFNGGDIFLDYFSGRIDEIRIYNRALSASEIEQLYYGSTTFITPTTHDFGTVKIGKLSASKTFTINNNSTEIVTLGELSITGDNAQEILTQTDTCSNQSLSPSATCLISLYLQPTSSGTKNATLQIATDDPNAPLLQASLTGNAEDRPILSSDLGGLIYSQTGETLSGVTLELNGETEITDENGIYHFAELPVGIYHHPQQRKLQFSESVDCH